MIFFYTKTSAFKMKEAKYIPLNVCLIKISVKCIFKKKFNRKYKKIKEGRDIFSKSLNGNERIFYF